jgi:hypothetical protein
MIGPTAEAIHSRRANREVSHRAVAIGVGVFTAVVVSLRLLSEEQAWAAAIKVVGPTLVLGVVPGILATLLCRPRKTLTALELLGCGIAVSFGLIHLLTVVAIVAHLGAALMLGALLAGTAIAVVWLIRRGPEDSTILVTRDETIVAVLLLVLASCLYIQGSPVDLVEDQVHAAIARRLAYLEHPAVDNLYFVRGVVYTYPFPSTHYFMGLVARLGDIDALFAYHKLRLFWGPAAIVMLYVAARAAFGARAIACVVAMTAIALAGSGAFATVPQMAWAHLVPYSHASDVAMGVLMPALLAMAFGYLQSESFREQAFLFGAASMLAFMLAVVHIREMVQFIAYLGCFAVVIAAFGVFRSHLRRTVTLLATSTAIVVAYVVWQRQAVTLVTDIVAEQRASLAARAAAAPLRSLLFTPASELLQGFVTNFDRVFDGLTPFILFAGPIVVVAFRHRPLVWLISSSTLAYLLVMTIPLVAIPYIYLTYYEILFTPVRNVIFFVYLFAGAFVYLVVAAVNGTRRTRLLALLPVGAAAGALGLLASLCLNRGGRGFFAPLIAAYALTFLWLRRRQPATRATTRVAATAMVAVLALAALFPDHQPAVRIARVNVRWTEGLDDEKRAALERRFSLTDREATPDSATMNVWSYRLRDISVQNVEALVKYPDVVDTHHIDRPTFRVEYQPPQIDDPMLAVEHLSVLQYPGWALTISTALLVWALGFLVPAMIALRRGDDDHAPVSRTAMRDPPGWQMLACALFIVPFAAWTARPTLSPLTLTPTRPFGLAATPQAMMRQIECVTRERTAAPFTGAEPLVLPKVVSCAPDYAVMKWMHAHVPANAILAINRWNQFLPSVFMPQQVVAFPGVERMFIDEETLFRDYYPLYHQSVRKYGTQPFFNSAETTAERVDFLETLGVTHVLVDPHYYESMRAVLDRLPQLFELKHADGRWAVYEINREAF